MGQLVTEQAVGIFIDEDDPSFWHASSTLEYHDGPDVIEQLRRAAFEREIKIHERVRYGLEPLLIYSLEPGTAPLKVLLWKQAWAMQHLVRGIGDFDKTGDLHISDLNVDLSSYPLGHIHVIWAIRGDTRICHFETEIASTPNRIRLDSLVLESGKRAAVGNGVSPGEIVVIGVFVTAQGARQLFNACPTLITDYRRRFNERLNAMTQTEQALGGAERATERHHRDAGGTGLGALPRGSVTSCFIEPKQVDEFLLKMGAIVTHHDHMERYWQLTPDFQREDYGGTGVITISITIPDEARISFTCTREQAPAIPLFSRMTVGRRDLVEAYADLWESAVRQTGVGGRMPEEPAPEEANPTVERSEIWGSW